MFDLKGKVNGKDCVVSWERVKGSKREMVVKMSLDGWLFKGKVVLVGKEKK